jgi:hypothetical protein
MLPTRTPACFCFRQNIRMKVVTLITAAVCLLLGSLFFLTLSHGNSNSANTTQWLNAFLETHAANTNDSSEVSIGPTTSFLVVVAIPPDPCDMCIRSMLNLIQNTGLDALEGSKICIIADKNVAQPLRRTTANLHMCVSVFSQNPRNLPADYISLYFYDLRTNRRFETLSIRSENPFDSSTENALVLVKKWIKAQVQTTVDKNNQQ